MGKFDKSLQLIGVYGVWGVVLLACSSYLCAAKKMIQFSKREPAVPSFLCIYGYNSAPGGPFRGEVR